jgi:DNA polymerase family A
VNTDHEIVCHRVVIPDSEFDAKKNMGEPPGPPICICAIEITKNGIIKHRLAAPYSKRPPWDRGPHDPYLTVGFALGAEAGSFMHVGWQLPVPAIDLYAEYMTIFNSEMSRGGDSKMPGPTLLQACRRFRISLTIDETRKEEMRCLAYSKIGHTPDEIALLQDYCLDDDCENTLKLFIAMLPFIDLMRAPIRAAFMMEVERVRWRGIPIDMPTYLRTQELAPTMAAKMRLELNRKLGAEIYFHDVFKRQAMLALMRRNNIPVPIDPKTGAESCATKLIKSMIETYLPLKEFYEDKRMIDALRTLKLEIGSDGRNRRWLNPFGTKTGRNNPSTNRYIFGLPHTMRSFIKPLPGMALAQLDVGAEEIGVAAVCSGDPQLVTDYLSGDPYRQFAAAALGVLTLTKQQRQIYKACLLGRIYGMGSVTLARNLNIHRVQAQRILDQMAARYPVLNAWLERVLLKAAHRAPVTCVLGWSLRGKGKAGEHTTFLNYPMQANSAELMRLIFVRASGIRLIGCAHDSFLIEDTIKRIEQTVIEMAEIIKQASRDLFGGFELRVDCNSETDIVRYPDRFVDEREREEGMRHWNRLMNLIEEVGKDEGKQAANF